MLSNTVASSSSSRQAELGSPGAGRPAGHRRPRRAEGWDISGHKIYTTGIEGLRVAGGGAKR